MKTSKLDRLISIILVFCFFFEINLSGITTVFAAGSSIEAISLTSRDKYGEEIASSPLDTTSENEDYGELTDKRELGTKYFMLGNGKYEAVLYGSPVHYLDNGEYKDIDNSLTLKKDDKGKSYYTNKANSFNVFIAASTDGGWSAGISQGDYEMKWKLEGSKSGKNGTASTYLSRNEWKKLNKKNQRMELPNLSSQVEYSDVLSNTKLDYQIISDIIKESITINSYNGINVFNQRISLKGLEFIQKEDGTIVAVDTNDHSKEIFYLPKPFAIDSGYDENFNEDIEVTLRNIKDIDETELAIIENIDDQSEETKQPETAPEPSFLVSPEETYIPTDSEVPDNNVVNTAEQEPALTSDTPEITETPVTSDSPEVIETPSPTETPEVTETPAPTETPEVTETPVPTETPEVTEAPILAEPDEPKEKDLFTGATNTYILTYTLDPEYLKNATYPIVIDPTIRTSLTCSNIKDSRICSDSDFDDTNYGNSYLTCTGNGSSSGTNYALVNFVNMPVLPASCMITNALFKMEKESTSSVTSYVAVHQITQAWTESTVTWNNFFASTQTYDPEFNGQHWNPAVEDFREVGLSAGVQYPWDVTQIVRKWYSGSPRYGLLLRDMSTYYKGWCAAESYGKEPCIDIEYVDYSGLESYWDYATAGLDRSGTANANIYNGNLVYTHTDLAMSGNLMPVTISHIFNSTTRNANDDKMLYGKGWRTNYDQRIEFIDHTIDPYKNFTKDYYKYTDSDGTVHFFTKNDDNEWKDEDGLGLEVKIDNNIPTITDKQDNKMVFYTIGDTNKPGFLNYLEDKNGNRQTVGYDSNNRINKITDGAGREVLLTRDANNHLYKIRELVNQNTYRETTFTYTYDSPTYRLTRITYPDGNYTVFSYDTNGNMDHVDGVDGKRLDFDYQTSYGGAEPYRISYMGQSTATEEGSELSFEYDYNITRLTDSEGRTATYQFNNRGNTVCVIGPDGSAGYAKFGTDGGGDMGKITSASKTQKFGKNYVKNHNMEVSSDWSFGESESTATEAYATDDKYLGAKSIKIVRTVASGYAYALQYANLQAGHTYTLSGYVKTNNISGTGAYLVIAYTNSQGVWQYLGTPRVTGTTDWQRYFLTFTLPSDISSPQVKIQTHVQDATGTAWFDCIQVEDGVIANKYNLIENADFEYQSSGVPTSWTRGADCGTSDIVVTTADNTNPVYMSDNRMHFVGSPSKNKYIDQVLNIPGGQQGDCYVIGAWCKGDSVSLMTTAKIGLAGKFNTADDWEWSQWQYNTGTDEWQFLCAKIVAKESYSNLTIRVQYKYNANDCVFDGIQVFKEGFDNELKYYEDDETGGNEGDLKSITYPDNTKETFKYDAKSNMTEHTYPDNTKSTFTYDTHNNPLTSTSSTGLVTTYNYDPNHPGLLLSTKVGDSTNYIKSDTIYDTNKNYIDKTTDPFGKQVDYTYDTFTGLLRDVTDPLQNTLHNTYDDGADGTDQLTGVSMSSGGITISNSYEYTNYRLTKVSHNAPGGGSVDYNINYNTLGWNTGTSVGSQSIAVNDLQDHTGRLNGVTYGNGQALSYTYDDYDRLIKLSQGTTDLYGYAYDLCGRVGYMKDYVQNVEYRYEYDIMDRVIKTYKKDLTTGNITTSASTYNTQSQMTAFSEKEDITTYTTSYTYDNDKRPDTATFGTYVKDLNYDAKLGTVTGYTIKDNGVTRYTKTINYCSGAEMGADAISPNSARVRSIYGPGYGFGYTYDARGFITKVQTDATHYFEYRYDGFGQLIRENYIWGSNTSYTIKYYYDEGGNLTHKERYDWVAGDGQVGAVLDTIYYTYDATWKDKLVSYDGVPITYDNIGNPLNDGIWTYTWTQGRRLSTVSNGTTSASYKYNNSGIRTQKTVNGMTTVFNLVGSKITWQKTGSATPMYFIYDSAGMLWGFKHTNGNVYFYERNAQGDIIAIVNSSGTSVVQYYYDAWGKLVSMTGDQALGNTNPFRYRGYYYDTETGLYYLNQRYYNPEWGRFVNADSLLGQTGKLSAHNIFAYCGNDPVNRFDPSGKKFEFTGNFFQKIKSIISLAILCIKPSGRTLVKAIADSDKTCFMIVKPGLGNSVQFNENDTNASNGKGSNAAVVLDPEFSPKAFTLDPTTNKGNLSNTPNFIVVGHELVHAYRGMNGIMNIKDTSTYTYIDESGNQRTADPTRIEELETMGIFDSTGTIVTENMLRIDFGLQERIRY